MSIRVSIDLDDIYDEMDRYDKDKMVEWLKEDGFMTYDEDEIFNETIFKLPINATLMEPDYIHKCAKLANLYHRLSNEDMEIIENLVKKY